MERCVTKYHSSDMVEQTYRDERHDDERPVGHGHPLGGGWDLGTGGVGGRGVIHLGNNVGGCVCGRRILDGNGLGHGWNEAGFI